MAGGALVKSDWENESVRGRNSNPMRAKFMVHLINGRLGWEAGTRTPIRRSRVCSLTIRRPPNGSILPSAPRFCTATTTETAARGEATFCGHSYFATQSLIPATLYKYPPGKTATRGSYAGH